MTTEPPLSSDHPLSPPKSLGAAAPRQKSSSRSLCGLRMPLGFSLGLPPCKRELVGVTDKQVSEQASKRVLTQSIPEVC